MTRPIVLATGGTGGHIFPALALAHALQSRRQQVHIFTNDLMPWLKEETNGIPISVLPAATIFRGGMLRSLFHGLKLLYACFYALFILSTLRPLAVVGFGGYPSFAPLFVARLMRLPTALHEQNRVMGRANRMLARLGVMPALSFADTELLPARVRKRAIITGNPIRSDIVKLGRPAYRPPKRQGPYRLLVIGGSQGAQLFARVVPAALSQLPLAMRQNLQLTQQCATPDFGRLLQLYRRARIQVELRDFFRDLPQRMAEAHLVIARGGAATVGELAALSRPSILVPLGHSLDGDQAKNVAALARQKACLRMDEEGFLPERLAPQLEYLLTHGGVLTDMARAARLQAQLQATARLADFVESLLPKPRGARKKRPTKKAKP